MQESHLPIDERIVYFCCKHIKFILLALLLAAGLVLASNQEPTDIVLPTPLVTVAPTISPTLLTIEPTIEPTVAPTTKPTQATTDTE